MFVLSGLRFHEGINRTEVSRDFPFGWYCAVVDGGVHLDTVFNGTVRNAISREGRVAAGGYSFG